MILLQNIFRNSTYVPNKKNIYKARYENGGFDIRKSVAAVDDGTF